MKVQLAQRGRALIDFEVGVRIEASRLQFDAETLLAKRGVTAETLPDDMDARHALIDSTLEDYLPYRTRGLLGEWGAKEHGPMCEEAFEEVKERILPELEHLAEGGTTITERPGFVPPRYWSEVWFHRTTGGWDASAFSGLVHGEIVHKRYVSRIFPGDVYAQRRRVLDTLPHDEYARILELGTSSGHYTVALAERYPNAHITGMDLSRRMLEQAQRVGNERGHSWTLIVGAGENTGFEASSFDLVTSYAVHHELPPKVIAQWFAEAHRVLKPGGDLLMADVPRYTDLDKLSAWRYDWAAKWGGEPFWRQAAMVDLAQGVRDAGFVDVRTEGLGPAKNPYLVYGRKPEE